MIYNFNSFRLFFFFRDRQFWVNQFLTFPSSLDCIWWWFFPVFLSENLWSNYGKAGMPIERNNHVPGSVPLGDKEWIYVLNDITSYFTLLVGIYFPSVTGKSPNELKSKKKNNLSLLLKNKCKCLLFQVSWLVPTGPVILEMPRNPSRSEPYWLFSPHLSFVSSSFWLSVFICVFVQPVQRTTHTSLFLKVLTVTDQLLVFTVCLNSIIRYLFCGFVRSLYWRSGHERQVRKHLTIVSCSEVLYQWIRMPLSSFADFQREA